MKTRYSLYMVLVLGFAALASAIGQKTSKEYDDMYYIPSDKKSVQSAEKQEPVKSDASTEGLSDYEKYINSLDNQHLQKSEIEYSSDSLEYAQDPEYVGSDYYEKDGKTYITNNYYTDGYYTSQIRRFYDPLYSAGYYDPFYYDPFYYQPGWSFNMSFGYPYMGFGFSFVRHEPAGLGPFVGVPQVGSGCPASGWHDSPHDHGRWPDQRHYPTAHSGLGSVGKLPRVW